VVIVFGNCEQALARHVAPPQHIFKERNYIGRLFRPAKRD